MWAFDIATTKAILAQALCLLAIHATSKQRVAERTAQLSLTPPRLTAKEVDDKAAKATEDAAHAALPWHRRYMSRRTAKVALPVIVFMAIELFIIVILPRISSQGVFNTFWTCFCAFLITIITSNNLDFFFGGPFRLSYIRTDGLANLSIKRESVTMPEGPASKWSDLIRNPRGRFVASLPVAVAVILLAANDMDGWVRCVAGATIVIHTSHSMYIKKISTRGLVKFVVAVFGTVCAMIPVCIVIGYLVMYFTGAGDSKDENKAQDDSNNVQNSQPGWLIRLMSIYADLLYCVPSLFFAELARRYDHFGPSASVALEGYNAAPGQAVAVPRAIDSRSCPTYKVAMLALGSSYIVTDLAVHALFATGTISLPRDDEEVRMMIVLGSFFLSTIIVPATTILYAWFKGEGKAWWTYEETWLPSLKDVDEKQDESDVEKALLADVVKQADQADDGDVKKPLSA